MRTSRKRKANAQYGSFVHAELQPSPAPLPKMPKRAEHSLYIAAVIGGASIFSWIVAIL
jgi:hypothetical protein